MKKLFLALLFFFALTVAIDVEPKMVGSSTVSLTVNWDVDLNGETPSTITFTSFAFLNTSTQNAVFTANLPFDLKTDELGNALLEFQLDPAEQQQRVSMHSTITASPESPLESIDVEVERFSQPSQFVNITYDISAKAREIVGFERNELRKAALLTSWVYNNVVYDLAYQDTILPSDEVFLIRRGVCNEYSHLLLAMLRSERIPSRFVAGFVYSGEKWAPHAWVEVAYNDKWYPFDATYNEGVLLDATHFKFANGVDQGDVNERLSARGTTAIDLSHVSLERAHEVSFITRSNFSSPPLLILNVSNETVSANSLQNVSLSITSAHPSLTAYPLSLDLPQEATIMSDRATLLLLSPGETSVFSWSVLIPTNLTEGYIYTYPLQVRSIGAKIEGALQAKKGDSQTIPLLQVKEVRVKDSQLVFRIKNSGNADFKNISVRLNLSNSTFTDSFSLSAGKETELSFSIQNANLSSRVEGAINLSTTSYSFVQSFLLEPSKASEPRAPAFNIQTERLTQESMQRIPLQTDYNSIILPVAIVLILFLAIIIKKAMRS